MKEPKSKEECLQMTIDNLLERIEQLGTEIRRLKKVEVNLLAELKGQAIVITALQRTRDEIWQECVEDTIRKIERLANGM